MLAPTHWTKLVWATKSSTRPEVDRVAVRRGPGAGGTDWDGRGAEEQRERESQPADPPDGQETAIGDQHRHGRTIRRIAHARAPGAGRLTGLTRRHGPAAS